MNDIKYDLETIYPPTAEELEDLKCHNVGLAARLASQLGRPLTEFEYEMFRKKKPSKKHELVSLPGDRVGIAL